MRRDEKLEMTSKFDFQEAFRRAIPRLARDRVDRVLKSLSEKPHPGAESIHEARKTLKSLRALLQLARGSIDAEVRRRENICFRDAGRLLPPLTVIRRLFWKPWTTLPRA